MHPIENHRAAAKELVCFAQTQGIYLEPFRQDFAFAKGLRFIDFWRKSKLPGTGPANEPLGTLHYAMQGAISVVPSKMKDFDRAFRGQWAEAGTFENVEQAFALLKAWLIDWKEVDELPSRSVRSYGTLPERDVAMDR